MRGLFTLISDITHNIIYIYIYLYLYIFTHNIIYIYIFTHNIIVFFMVHMCFFEEVVGGNNELLHNGSV